MTYWQELLPTGLEDKPRELLSVQLVDVGLHILELGTAAEMTRAACVSCLRMCRPPECTSPGIS